VKPTREQWRAIPGYEGIYEVSDRGRVRSLDREVPHGALGSVRVAGRMMVPVDDGKGYRRVGMTRHNKKTHYRIHQLVLMAFVGPCPPKQEVRHLNGIKTDNRLVNLQYGTKWENVQDILKHGNNAMLNRTHCKNGHPLVWSDNRNQRYCPICTREKIRMYGRDHTVRSRQGLAQGVEIDTANERWVPIPGYEGEYSASDQGRIRSEERLCNNRWGGQRLVESKIMAGSVANGYRQVGLMTDGKQKAITVHSLILLAFVGPRAEGLVIRHLNDNRIDNRLVNLQYGTQQENWEDRRRNRSA
jgi:hypothetical protein